MGEVVKTKGDAKAEPADIVAAEQKKREEKSKARDARKKAAAEEKKKEKEEELKKRRKDQLQQVNSIRNKDHHNRQLPRLHRVTPAPPAPPPPIKANVPTAPVACAKMVPISGADASKKSDKAAATRSLVTPLDTFPVLKMAPISSADASENIDINQPAPVTSVSSSTGSEERAFFVGRILVRISSSANQTKTNDQQTNDNVRLEFEKDTDQGTVMCSQINKDNNNAPAATDVPGTTTVTNQLADELNMKTVMCSQINKDNNDAAAATDVPGTTTVTHQLAEELNMKEKQVVSDAKTTVNLAKNSDDDDDDDDKFEVARGKRFIRAEQIALNAEATERTQNQAERKKTQATRKKGYNKFSVLLEESENEEQDIDRAAEEAATKIEEKPHESEKEQDIEARRAEEAATTAKKKREKRERKKKRKVATTIEEKSHENVSDAQSWSSVGVLSLALVCFLSLTAFYMS